MPTKIRLQRFGKKGQAFYRIVVADSRAPRDGMVIENIGTYNPLTVPATININADRALYWMQVGAQPTETAKAILSYKGIIYKNHLLKGVTKGAITHEQADAKFNEWVAQKQQKIVKKIEDKDFSQNETLKKKIQEEAKVNEARAKAIAEKRAKEVAAKMKIEQQGEKMVEIQDVSTIEEAIVAQEPAIAKEAHVVEKTQTNKVAPIVEENPIVEETTPIEEALVSKETPIAEVDQIVEETPIAEKVSEEENKTE